MTTFLKAMCIVMVFASCKKDAQPISSTEILSAPKADKELKKCDISRIISYDPNFMTQTITFEYNKKGDPVSVIPSYIGTGTPRLLFRYDARGRLTDFIGVYGNPADNPAFEFWHKYGHNNHGQIILDTTYIFGIYGQGPASGRLVTYGQYEYDKEGRMIKIIGQSLSFPPLAVVLYH